MKEGEVMRLIRSILELEGVRWVEDGGFVRFRAAHGGMLWETACRGVDGAILFYARFPFVCAEPDKARRRCEEINRKLIRGALFLGADGSPVYRCTAELDDVFGAEGRIGEALNYSAQVMARYWGGLAAT